MSADDLIEAAFDGDIQEVLWLLDVRKVNINAGTQKTCRWFERIPDPNALTAAVGGGFEFGREEIVSLLLNRGADVNSPGGEYGSALGTAAYMGSKVIVSLLLNRGADVNSPGGEYGSALGAAAFHGHTEIVSLLLDRGADVNSTGGEHGSALGAAAFHGHTEIVSLLLDRGADVNNTGGEHESALGAAAFRGHTEIVSLLLDRGADVSSTCSKYGPVVSAAAYSGHKEIVSLLLGRGADVMATGGRYESALSAAACGRQREIVSLLLDRGADVNSPGGEYGPALGAAAFAGQKEIVSLLLDRGADLNSPGGQYGSALGAAAFRGHTEIVLLLLNRGANVNIVGGKYGTALVAAAYRAHEDTVMLSLLIARGADINATNDNGQYGTALAVAALQGNTKAVILLLEHGANCNIVSGDYGTALAVASYNGHRDIMLKLLQYPGTDVNIIGGKYGTALGAAFVVASTSEGKWREKYLQNIKLLLDHKADINLVHSIYGSLLGNAAYKGNKELVSLLLAGGADAFHVGGKYGTVTGEYPTALDAAQAGKASEDIIGLVTRTMNAPVQGVDTMPWPPFPMPFRGSSAAIQVSCETPLASTISSCLELLETIVNKVIGGHVWDGNLTPAQADLPCKGIDEELLTKTLVALVGVNNEVAEHLQVRLEPQVLIRLADWHQVWIQNDVRYLVNQGYDLGLAYAAARVAWKSFNDQGFNVAVHRDQWLARARQIDEDRGNSIDTDDTGQKLIKSPYLIMPRRIWDLKSNRVVEFRMLHSEVLTQEHLCGSIVVDQEKPCPRFWAITHSWTYEMSPVKTSVNQYQWPTPLPRELDLEHGVRRELLSKGAEYVWLDVLCLRQHSAVDNHTKEDEWAVDVPTIGNIYRSAVGIARYFNGLGQAFSTTGWDDPRHWLRRAWTLQEIRSENTTYNAGMSHNTSAHTIMNTESIIGEKVTTLREAIHPIVKLAAQVDSPSGCSVYDLVQQMAKRFATQPTDKVVGLFYLLRTIQLPTYNADIGDGDAWAKCFHVLPFGRKIELLFDFPYGGDSSAGPDCQWFPTWKQLMEWPARDPTYDHTVAVYEQHQAHPQLAQAQKPEHLLVSDIWAISDVCQFQTKERKEYEIKIGNEIFGFYSPYVRQKPIEVSSCGRYTLVTTNPDHSYNWVVCESLGQRPTTPDGTIKTTEIECLKKLGVLRTDSCSELFLGTGRRDSILKKINALFV